MKLHLSRPLGLNVITAYGDDFIAVNDRHHHTSLIVLPERLLADWPVTGLAVLERFHFAALLELRPELVLLGTGRRHRFPRPDVTRDLADAGIGLEIMGTGAACRTYNILAAEGRMVAAALIIEA